MNCFCQYDPSLFRPEVLLIVAALGALCLALYACAWGYHWYQQRTRDRRAGRVAAGIRAKRRAARQAMDQQAAEFVNQVHDLRR